mgnify:CR=1 FL=1
MMRLTYHLQSVILEETRSLARGFLDGKNGKCIYHGSSADQA